MLSTISDKKIAHDSSGTVNYYIAEVLSQNDYYPFGMLMPGRKYSSTSSYRYGFNGKENDNEVNGEGDQQDYGMRIYDPRIGKFLSMDPVAKNYPWNSPYSFAEGDLIRSIDLDGLEKQVANAPAGFAHEGGAVYQKMEFRGNYYTFLGHTSSLFRVLDNSGNNYWVKEQADLVNGYGNIKKWKKSYQYWTEEPNTKGYSQSANWIPYREEGQRASDDARSFESAVGKTFIIGTISVAGGFGLASLSIESLAARFTTQAFKYAFTPKPGFNPTGAVWDFVNQKFMQGKSFGDINWASIGTSAAFGKGNFVSNAIFGASGNFLNLSVNRVANGNILNFNSSGLQNFAAGAAGSMISGGAGGYIKSANQSLISHELVRHIVNETLGNTLEASGQIFSNTIEHGLNRPPKK